MNAGSEAITSLIRGIRARRRACPTAPSPSVATPRIAGCTSSCDQIEAGVSSCACRCVTDCRSNAPEFAPSGDQATSPRRESALCALAAGLLLVPHEDAYQCVRACEAVVGVVQKEEWGEGMSRHRSRSGTLTFNMTHASARPREKVEWCPALLESKSLSDLVSHPRAIPLNQANS